MPAQVLSFTGLKKEVGSRMERNGHTVSKSAIDGVMKALTEEIIDCLSQGYKVTLPGVVTLEPQLKPGRKKGAVISNPFDGTSRTLRSDEPDKFIVKAKRSLSLHNHFPSIKSKAGIELAGVLKPKPKRKAAVKK